jgi:ATP/maltotriose-dependent transcriptional regulator MalT
LAAGNIDAAAAGIARAMSESTAVRNRASILAAAVEILGAAGDHERGRTASAELEDIATEGEVPLLAAMAAHAAGAMLVAVGEPSAALPRLREAMEHWRELEMPYEGARTRVQIGLACHALGDVDSCALEHDAARAVFDELGARPEKERLDRLRSSRASEPSGRPAGLTRRECEVLRLVAAGRTNRQIGADLVISEHTVARHVQNIFAKLGVSSRAAATAFAYEHGLA